MTKWQYKVVHKTELKTEADFNNLGTDGWELVFMSPETGNAFFKRQDNV